MNPQGQQGQFTHLSFVPSLSWAAAAGFLFAGSIAPRLPPAVGNWVHRPVGFFVTAFAALAAGAHGLKLFPAEMISPATVKALRAVLPKQAALIPVGGITPDNMASYRAAGASGFGLGSALYAPGRSTEQVRAQAAAFVRAYRAKNLSA